MSEGSSSEERALLERLRRDALVLGSRFGLAVRSVDAEHPRVRRRYGVCFDDGAIRIRLRHARTGRLLKYSFLVDTLCHELAHLRHFDHGPRFKAFYLRILGRARREGIYRPTPRPPAEQPPAERSLSLLEPRRIQGPVQLELF
jgi:predicted metal-dependent hydrolase